MKKGSGDINNYLKGKKGNMSELQNIVFTEIQTN